MAKRWTFSLPKFACAYVCCVDVMVSKILGNRELHRSESINHMILLFEQAFSSSSMRA